jgi:hypothetical protein
MTCADIQEQYLDYMEGALDPAASSEVESHLSLCATCAREVTMLRWTAQTLRALPAVAPPADLRLRVRMQLLPEPVAPPEPFYQRWLDWLRPRRWAMPVALATGVAAMLLIAVALPSMRPKQAAEQISPPLTASVPPGSLRPAMEGAPPAAQSNAEEIPPVQIDVIPGRPRANDAPAKASPPGGRVLLPPQVGAGGYRSAPSSVNRVYPRQALPSPYSTDIKEPIIKRSEHGVHVDQQPPSHPPVPPNHDIYRNPRLAMNQQPQKPSGSGGEKSPDDVATEQGGGTPQPTTKEDGSHASSYSDVASEARPSQSPHGVARGSAKVEGSDNAMNEPSNKSQTDQAVTPQKAVPTDSNLNAPKGAPSVLKSSPILTLSLNRSQQITLHIQPTTDLAQAEVLVTLPPTIDLRGATRIGFLPYRVYSGPIFSNQPVPITLDLLPRSPGRYVINVTLRSPSLSRPITQRIQVRVLLGRMGQ